MVCPLSISFQPLLCSATFVNQTNLRFIVLYKCYALHGAPLHALIGAWRRALLDAKSGGGRCLLEIYTALRHHIPIVAVNVQGAIPYSFEEASKLLGAPGSSDGNESEGARFERELESRNPGACAVIKEQPIPRNENP